MMTTGSGRSVNFSDPLNLSILILEDMNKRVDPAVLEIRLRMETRSIPDGAELVPDIPIVMRSTDYFARFDPVMAAILARSSGAPAAPSGDVLTVNGASFRRDQGLAPGSFAAAFGNFATAPDDVLVSGISGQILAASRTQVNFIVPDCSPLSV